MDGPVMKVILRAWFIVGTLDIMAALLQYYLKTQNNPIIVLQYIASGVFGDDAYTGRLQMAAWGLLFHYIIALAFTVLYFRLFRALPFIRRMGVLSGVLYGVFMWSVTQFIVIPLSSIPGGAPLKVSSAATAITILIVCIGIPLYYLARSAYGPVRKP